MSNRSVSQPGDSNPVSGPMSLPHAAAVLRSFVTSYHYSPSGDAPAKSMLLALDALAAIDKAAESEPA